jgi:pyrroloquinoline quinone biosynthesis protein E
MMPNFIEYKAPLPAPAPAAGLSYYEKIRSERLSVSVEARENWTRYEKWIASGCSSIDPQLLPIKAHISPNSQCNFRCTMCAVSDFPRGMRAENMTVKRFIQRLDQMPSILELMTTGLAETLMMPQKDLLVMLGEARLRSLWVQLVTNGSLLHQREWIPNLIDLDLNEIVISLDATSAELFQQIRRGSNFQRVVKNIALISEAMRRRGIENRLKVQFLMQRVNTCEIERIVPFVADLGVQSLQISVDVFDWGNRSWRVRCGELQTELDRQALELAVDKGKSLGVRVGVVTVNNKYVADGDPRSRCRWPFVATMISSDDRFVPCCHISNPDHFEIKHGVGADASVTDVWRSEAYLQFRTAHLMGNIPDACKSCYRSGTPEAVPSVPISLTRGSQ